LVGDDFELEIASTPQLGSGLVLNESIYVLLRLAISLATLATSSDSERDLEILALRHQVAVSAPPRKAAGARSGRSPYLRGSWLATSAWAADVLPSYLAPLAPRTHASALVGFPAATSSWPTSDLGGAPATDRPPRARKPAVGRSPDPRRVA